MPALVTLTLPSAIGVEPVRAIPIAPHVEPVEPFGAITAPTRPMRSGRVPLPGAEVESHGLRLRAEGGSDHRGRVRIGTVLVSRIPPADDGEQPDE